MIQDPLLRSPDGRRYLIAQLMDAIGGGLALVALPWLVLDAGGSRSLAGAAYLMGTVPYVLLGLPAGSARRPLAAAADDGCRHLRAGRGRGRAADRGRRPGRRSASCRWCWCSRPG